MERHVYAIEGMTCGGCSASLEKLLRQEPGIAAVAASHADGSCEVTLDPSRVSETRIAEIVTKAGFTLAGEIV